jgi:hypothetical protein
MELIFARSVVFLHPPVASEPGKYEESAKEGPLTTASGDSSGPPTAAGLQLRFRSRMTGEKRCRQDRLMPFSIIWYSSCENRAGT